jgi:hypothetical protein
MDKPENEMFYIDKNGEKLDRLIHEEILDGVDGYPLELIKRLKKLFVKKRLLLNKQN